MTLLLLAAGFLAWPGAPALPGTVVQRLGPAPGSPGLPAGVVLPVAAGLPGLAAWMAAGSPAVGASAALVGATLTLLIRSAARARRLRRERTELLDAVRSLGREVNSGADLDSAVAAVRLLHGSAVSAVLGRLSSRGERPGPSPPAGDTEFALTAAVQLSRRFGAPLSVLLAGVADGLADAQRSAEHRSSAVAGARLSGWVLAALPLMGVGLGAGMGADPLPVLWGGGLGSTLLLAGTVLLCVGLLWSARIARSS